MYPNSISIRILVPLRLPLRGSFKCFIGHKGPCTQMVYTLAISVHWGPSICYGGGGRAQVGKLMKPSWFSSLGFMEGFTSIVDPSRGLLGTHGLCFGGVARLHS